MATARASSAVTSKSIPLTESEQDTVAEELRKQAALQVNSTRTMFFLLYLTVAAIFCGCGVYSVFYPLEISHQRVFSSIVSDTNFIAFYFVSAACFILSAMSIKVSFFYVFMNLSEVLQLLTLDFYFHKE